MCDERCLLKSCTFKRKCSLFSFSISWQSSRHVMPPPNCIYIPGQIRFNLLSLMRYICTFAVPSALPCIPQYCRPGSCYIFRFLPVTHMCVLNTYQNLVSSTQSSQFLQNRILYKANFFVVSTSWEFYDAMIVFKLKHATTPCCL